MAIKTIYTCDRCKEEQKDRESIWYVEIYSYEEAITTTRSASIAWHLCESCLRCLGKDHKEVENVTADS